MRVPSARRHAWLLLLIWLLACGPGVRWSAPPSEAAPIPPGSPSAPSDAELEAFFEEESASGTTGTLERLSREAEAVDALVESEWVKRWLDGVELLPPVLHQTIYRDASKSRWVDEARYAKLAPNAREELVVERVDTERFYYTKYGSPIAYARAVDVAAQTGMPSPAGRGVVDFGYGTIGHLRLFAALGAKVTGVDVDPFLRALYAGSGNRGPFPPGEPEGGLVQLVHGRFPVDAAVVSAVGRGNALFLSKNVLKRGYIHPAEDVPESQTIDLGVSDDAFVKAVRDALEPGGYFVIYNITPPPNGSGRPYRTWADGRCPFPRNLMEAVGFEVLAFDVDDSEAARAQGRALGWDADVELDEEIFALYTVARRR